MHEPEAFAEANGISLCYDSFGNAADPPLVLMVYPCQAGTTWSGSTNTVISGLSVVANYTGKVIGKETLSVPAGTFEDAWKVELSYSGSAGFASATGTETYWFVPFRSRVEPRPTST